jgi:hypothetical protein
MKLRENFSIIDRDPKIYLGIDGNGIPKELFKYDELFECGYYSFENEDIKTTEVLLAYEDNFFYLIHLDYDYHILKEDIKSKLIHHVTTACKDNKTFMNTEKGKNIKHW